MEHAGVTVGRACELKGAAVTGIVACVPSLRIDNSYFIERFGDIAVNDVVKMIGVQNRRWVEGDTSTSDLCFAAANKLLLDLKWSSDTVDALIFVSQTPDYRLPATACSLHHRLELAPATIAFDVNLGCSGYPYALWLAMTMINSGAARRVLLAVGDTISRVVDPTDRSTAMLFGDAGTVTAVEVVEDREHAPVSRFILGTDGAGVNNLIIPHGGFKHAYFDALDKSKRDPTCLYMDGGEIFNFTLTAVPALVRQSFQYDMNSVDGYASFLFHQANQFMLKHLIKKAQLPVEKVPINIDRFGNTSCASIPLLMCTDLRDQLLHGLGRVAMFGFGVGYSWGAACVDMPPLSTVELIEL